MHALATCIVHGVEFMPVLPIWKGTQVGKNQEKAQSEKDSHSTCTYDLIKLASCTSYLNGVVKTFVFTFNFNVC